MRCDQGWIVNAAHKNFLLPRPPTCTQAVETLNVGLTLVHRTGSTQRCVCNLGHSSQNCVVATWWRDHLVVTKIQTILFFSFSHLLLGWRSRNTKVGLCSIDNGWKPCENIGFVMISESVGISWDPSPWHVPSRWKFSAAKSVSRKRRPQFSLPSRSAGPSGSQSSRAATSLTIWWLRWFFVPTLLTVFRASSWMMLGVACYLLMIFQALILDSPIIISYSV